MALYKYNRLNSNLERTTSDNSSCIVHKDSDAGVITLPISQRLHLEQDVEYQQIPYFVEGEMYVTYVEILEWPSEILYSDPLEKYKKLLKQIDFSEIGTANQIMEEELRVYYDLMNYRKRATSLFIDGKES
ncbi:MAG: hypothetical protein ISS47_09135 [Candidatus Omnitrophica bacterium]|nr:hypothetical protein [Candidatus Omnitrophota bacterium]